MPVRFADLLHATAEDDFAAIFLLDKLRAGIAVDNLDALLLLAGRARKAAAGLIYAGLHWPQGFENDPSARPIDFA